MSVFPQLSANQQVLKTSVLSTLFSNRLSSQLSKFISLTVALFIVCIASLFIGAKSIPPSVVIDVLLSQTISTDSLIIIESRLPRTLTGLFVGSALAVAGCLIQSITRNPLADPG
ncbi:MAG: iron chelate uptake ABC transporter family permease subunit, partial [Vibrio metschnikovii]